MPKYLQELGYNTYYVGKFLVEYTLYNYRPVPDGELTPLRTLARHPGTRNADCVKFDVP